MRPVSPIVIFGSGGSGTRAVCRFCQMNDTYMGDNLNESLDAMEFVPALSASINPILCAVRSLDYEVDSIPEHILQEVLSRFRSATELHLKGWNEQHRWGFKNPRQIFVLPILAKLFPEMTVVHLLRDGRDMILSENHNQARQHYSALFDKPWVQDPATLGEFWGVTNLQAAKVGHSLFGPRYVQVRIEDLCGPARSDHVARLAAQLGFEAEKVRLSASAFTLQKSFGRGNAVVTDELAKPGSYFQRALKTFGYAS